jgi:hypothetical protein
LTKAAFVYTFKGGVAVRQDVLYDWESTPEALASALRRT